MSWWSASEVENEIMRATSSSIPSGEQDLALNLEISDSVRSKGAPVKEVLRVLRKRLYDANPNIQILALHLLDLLVKNGGSHFLKELSAKSFIDSYVAQLLALHNQNRNPEGLNLMLEYFQSWALASAEKPELQYLRDKYEELKRRKDLEFPDVGPSGELRTSFLESETAPEWVDSDTCMKSGQPFTLYSRKHHCRNCGGVFLQEYCKSFRSLPHYGINIPVRVCEDCNNKLDQRYMVKHSSFKHKTFAQPAMKRRVFSSNNSDIESRYREDIEKAVSLSLREAKGSSQQDESVHVSAAPSAEEEDMDDDMKRAIAASLAEINKPSVSNNIINQHPSDSHELSQEPVRDTQYQRQQIQQPHPLSQIQKQQKVVKPALPAHEKQEIEQFCALVTTATPRDAVYDTRIISLSNGIIELQPKIINELRNCTKKLSVIEDLHGKLLAVSEYYDRLLEAELNPELGLEAPKILESDATGNRREEQVPVENQNIHNVTSVHYGYLQANQPNNKLENHENEVRHETEVRLKSKPEAEPLPEPEEEPNLIDL